MFSLRCTQKLMKRMKTVPAEPTPPTTTVLGDWDANLVIVGRRQLVLCCSERTFLPVIVVAKDIGSLVPRLRGALGNILAAINIPSAAINEELLAMDSVIVTKTASSVVVGVMNEYGYMMGGQQHGDLLKLSLELADTPLFASTSRVLWPIRATQAAMSAPRGLYLVP